MMKVRQLAILLVVLFTSFSARANDISELIDYYEDNNIPYAVMIAQNSDGSFQIYVVAVSSAGYISEESHFGITGEMTGGANPNGSELFGDWIDRLNLSVNDECQFNPLCLAATSSGGSGGT